MTARIRRNCGPAALIVSLLALLMTFTGLGEAAKKALPGPSTKPKAYGLLRLNAKRQFPATAIPKVNAAKAADTLGEKTENDLTDNCNAQSVDMGTWCMLANPYPVVNEDTGKNNYFWASQKCAELGGWLPDAGQLMAAAPRVKLASTIDDSQLTASTDLDPTDGKKDRREMSSTLVTTAAGSSAAGSQGVTEGSAGDPKTGEPNPTPFPANPSPSTLQYVTVYDNRDKGGFAGSKPVSQPENFRCAFAKKQGPAEDIGEEPAAGDDGADSDTPTTTRGGRGKK